MEQLKERHGCVNAWLWLVIIANFCMVIYYTVTMFGAYDSSISLAFGLTAVLSVVNILGAILLMRWNKYGFYLYTVSALLAAVFCIVVLGAELYVIGSSLFVILIWWGILHIKKNNVSAWQLMENGWDYKHCRHLYQVFATVIGVLLIMTIITYAGRTIDTRNENVLSDDVLVDSVAVDSVAVHAEWSEFSDDTGICAIKTPNDFKKADLCEGQVLGLLRSDYDPAIVVIQESVGSVESAGITTVKGYANAIVEMNRNVKGALNFKKLSAEPYGDNSYLIVYEISIGEDTYCYNILATKTRKNFYYCQVYCLKQYVDNLQPVISNMLNSFRVRK